MRYIIFIIAFFVFAPKRALAIPPPEIANNLVVILTQISAVFTLLSGSLFLYLKKFKKLLFGSKLATVLFFLAVFVVISGSLVFINDRRDQKMLTVLKKDRTERPPATDIDGRTANDISLSEFERILESDNDFLVVDARMEEEYEAGHIDGAMSIPLGGDDEAALARLSASVTENTKVIFYCFDSYRSKFISEKFRRYHEPSYYLKGQAMLLSDHWQGETFSLKFTSLLDQKDLVRLKDSGVTMFDPRAVIEYGRDHMDGTVNIPVMSQSFDETNGILKNYGPGEYMVLCFDKLSCFEAYILSYRMNNNTRDRDPGFVNLGIMPINTDVYGSRSEK